MSPTQPVQVLAVDDEPSVRDILRRGLERKGYQVRVAGSVPEARAELAKNGLPALMLVDINLPGEDGLTLLREMAPRSPDTAVVMVTAQQDVQVAVSSLRAGAYDFLLKPFDMEGLWSTVERALERRALELENRAYKQNLESLVQQRTQELNQRNVELLGTQRALLRSLCHMAEFRDMETGFHLERVAHYARILAEQLQRSSPYAAQVDDRFIANIVEVAPLHDLGKIGIPDQVLLKAGRHTPEEWTIMKRHAAIGRQVLTVVKSNLPSTVDGSFLEMGIVVAGSHHEKWDGTGYPDGLKGEQIPLAARIVAVIDFFDACTSSRVYRPEPIPTDKVLTMLADGRSMHFDPAVIDAFMASQEEILDKHAMLQD